MAALLSLGRCGTFVPAAASLAEAHARTFRPRKAAVYTQLKQHIDATIGSGNLREAVSSSPALQRDVRASHPFACCDALRRVRRCSCRQEKT